MGKNNVFRSSCLGICRITSGSCATGFSPAEWVKGPSPTIGTKIFESSSVGPTTTVLIDRLARATFTGSSRGGDIVHIVKKTDVTTKTYKWVGTDLIYGVLTITKTYTTIKRRNGNFTNTLCGTSDGTNVNGTVTLVSHVTCASFSRGAVPATIKAGTTLEYTGANPANSRTTDAPAAAPTLPTAIWSDFTGGTPYNTPFGGSMNIPMRAILGANTNPEYLCVAGFLNALTVPNYVMDTGDVMNICNDHSLAPGGSANFEAFMVSTWT